MGNISERDKTLLVILIIGLLFFFFYQFVWAGMGPAYRQARQDLAETQSRLEEAEQKISRLAAVQQRREEAWQSFTSTERNFRLNLTAGDPYLELAEKSRALRVIAVQPQAVQDREFYLELPLVMRVQGDYLAVAGFMEQVERLPNLPRIKTLRVAAVAGPEGTATGSPVEAEINLSLYGSKAAASMLPARPAIAGRFNAFTPALDTLLAAALPQETGAPAAGSPEGELAAEPEVLPSAPPIPPDEVVDRPPVAGEPEEEQAAGDEPQKLIEMGRYRFPVRR